MSVPYIDAFGTGIVCLVTHLYLSDITFFNQDQTTYAFMIAKTGRTLCHPLLPAPSEAYDDPFFIDIRTLETDSKFLEVFASMTRYAFTCISYSRNS